MYNTGNCVTEVTELFCNIQVGGAAKILEKAGKGLESRVKEEQKNQGEQEEQEEQRDQFLSMEEGDEVLLLEKQQKPDGGTGRRNKKVKFSPWTPDRGSLYG